jgi:catechol 2,3-dioxygenase-like lactoylglutathione lyase family enzyme
MNLNQVTVPAIDVAASVHFYQQLGLKLIVESLPKYARFECPNGNATFSLHVMDELPTGPGVVVYFECENLDETVQQLIARGIVFDTLPMDQEWLWREAYLHDPAGNKICLYRAGENRLHPPWRINP